MPLRILPRRPVSAGGPESYPHRLREELRTRHPDVDWESLNLSNDGYGTARMLVLMREVPRLEPDFVVLDPTGTNEFGDESDRARRDSIHRGLGGRLVAGLPAIGARVMAVSGAAGSGR